MDSNILENDMALYDSWINAIPKVELHVHLEGAIPHDVLWELVNKYGGDNSVSSLQDLKGKFVYKDFSHFIETWVWKNNYLREYDDFEYIAEAVAQELTKQNIRYAEVFYSPSDFKSHRLDTQRLTEAIRKGFNKIQDIRIGMIPDLVRDFGPKKAEKTLEEINSITDLGILGIGLGGSENKFPPGLYANVFRSAKNLGLHTTVHAGEASGSESVWEAIKLLNPDRIGHGTRAIEDEALVEYLVAHKIPLEMCPLSNIRTGIVKDITYHPVREFYQKGILVTINTDDPAMFGNSLAEEYHLLVKKLGFSKGDIRAVILNGIQASWLDELEKCRMLKNFTNDPSW